MERDEMKNIAAGLKLLACCFLVPLGAVMLLAILTVVAMLLMTGPLLALAGLIVGISMLGVVAAIVFAGPPTAVSSGLTVSAIVRDSAS
jgi:hypothetical protein